MKKSWMIVNFNIKGPVTVTCVQPSDAFIIKMRSYDTADGVHYTIRLYEPPFNVPVRTTFEIDTERRLTGCGFVDGILLKPPKEEESNIVNLLPDEILCNIFERLDMNDFFEITQVCTRFRAIADVGRIHGKLRVNKIPVWRLEKYLNSFGEYVRNVELKDTINTYLPLQLISRYCTNVRELAFDIQYFADQPDIGDLNELMRGVEKLHIMNARCEHDMPPPGCKFKSLSLDVNRVAPAHHFDNLIELKLFITRKVDDDRRSPYNILAANPQIRKLEMNGTCLDFAEIPKFTNLQEFRFTGTLIRHLDTFHQFATNLKILSIHVVGHTQIGDLLNCIHEKKIPIECLQLRSFYQKAIVTGIMKLSNIKILMLDFNIGFNGLSEILRSCKNLIEVHVDYSTSIGIEEVERILSLDDLSVKKLTFKYQIFLGHTRNSLNPDTMRNINRLIEEKKIILTIIFNVHTHRDEAISLELADSIRGYLKWAHSKYLR